MIWIILIVDKARLVHEPNIKALKTSALEDIGIGNAYPEMEKWAGIFNGEHINFKKLIKIISKPGSVASENLRLWICMCFLCFSVRSFSAHSRSPLIFGWKHYAQNLTHSSPNALRSFYLLLSIIASHDHGQVHFRSSIRVMIIIYLPHGFASDSNPKDAFFFSSDSGCGNSGLSTLLPLT